MVNVKELITRRDKLREHYHAMYEQLYEDVFNVGENYDSERDIINDALTMRDIKVELREVEKTLDQMLH